MKINAVPFVYVIHFPYFCKQVIYNDMASYFIYKDGEESGPYSTEQLKDMEIKSDTLVWTEGMADWKPAWQVDEIKYLLRQGESHSTPPPIPAEYQAQHQSPQERYYVNAPKEAKPRKSRHGCLFTFLIFVVAIVAMAMTCPSAEKHKEVLSTELNSAVGSAATESYGLLGMIGGMLASGVVNVAVNNFLVVDNYVVCSVGKWQYEGDSTTISFGILNHVFVFIDRSVMRQRIGDAMNSL